MHFPSNTRNHIDDSRNSYQNDVDYLDDFTRDFRVHITTTSSPPTPRTRRSNLQSVDEPEAIYLNAHSLAAAYARATNDSLQNSIRDAIRSKINVQLAQYNNHHDDELRDSSELNPVHNYSQPVEDESESELISMALPTLEICSRAASHHAHSALMALAMLLSLKSMYFVFICRHAVNC